MTGLENGSGSSGASEIEALQRFADESEHIVFFGGAGVSTESGIKDFRSVDGLYRQKWKYPPEVVLSADFFEANTEEFYEFYRAKMLAPDAKPNAAHKKLAELEKAGKLDAVITQNIDGLHQAAGSKNVLELHGSTLRNYCRRCGKFHSPEFILHGSGVPHCECGGVVKPDVVLYGESLDGDTMEKSVRAISRADLLIIAGTSLTVYPAAGLVRWFGGKHLVVINLDATGADRAADLTIRKPVGEVLGQLRVNGK